MLFAEKNNPDSKKDVLIVDELNPIDEKYQGCTSLTKKCKHDKDENGMLRTNECPPCCRKHIRDICFYVSDLFTEFDIAHWMDFGTLVGAAREGGVLTWDKDADFGIFEEDIFKVKNLVHRIKKDGFWLDLRYREPGPADAPESLMRIRRNETNRNFVDLFPWRNNKGIMKSRFGKNIPKKFPSYFVEKFSKVTLHGKPINAPYDTEKFLEFRFGNWKQPERRWHRESVMKLNEITEYCESQGWEKS